MHKTFTTIKKNLVLIAALVVATSAHAQLTVSDPWVRATVPQQKATGAFMLLTSAKDSRLVQVSSPVAGTVEIHQMEMADQMMRMRPVDGLDLPAGKSVNLASGGYHIMLMNLKQQLKDGDTVPVTLLIEGKDKKRDSVTVKMPVKPINFTGPNAAGAMKH
jgi:copper(I)-binding protein